MTEVLAILPARDGSTRTSVNPLSPVAGHPLIGHTVTAARMSKSVTRIVVATPHSGIADVARRFGGQVVMQQRETNDTDAMLEVLEQLQASENYRPDVVVQLAWSAPLTTSEEIDRTVDALAQQQADSALAVVEFPKFVWQHDASGCGVGVNHDRPSGDHSDDSAPQFLEAHAVYAMRTSGLLETKQRFFGKTALVEMPRDRHLVLSDSSDLDVAELRLRRRFAMLRDKLLPDSIGAVVFDFDGVFTDNSVTVDQEGRESTLCSRGDGMGIGQLKKTGIPLLVLSKEPVPIVMHRCGKLGLECLHGVDNKLPLLDKWLAEHGVDRQNTVYMGNDINDIECLAAVGCGTVPADAHPDVLPVANLVLDYPGGRGAVRQLCDMIVSKVTTE
ncbi:cytidylyltransferase domain-containing protein [Aeoliella mucimassa]|uniref:N-acylneuraminate cytidylyltransferase n=1 Tax=Aeoliella mucimassa TaxID=2527972 RepID=A0A518AUT1_9BACT|nr:HAD hydrolase family protein [Aeoliella mucimassa]QDU58483.1 3-deoxy-D-manno-octulosonate 8-phosphate phosphatase KdsC [Aeoliella mucimassa]